MMSNGAYVFIDVSRKQEFIFKNNELKACLYRSFVIRSLTEDLSEDPAFENIKLKITLNNALKRYAHSFRFSGGGNSIIYFMDKHEARHFIHEYTIKVHEKYPELELYISLVDEDKYSDDTNDHTERSIRDALYAEADRLKDTRRGQFRRWTYGIEKIDASGMPVRKLTKKQKTEQREIEKMVQERLMTKLDQHSWDGDRKLFRVTNELSSYRRNKAKQEIGKSYIGIISIDGNQMGEITNVIQRFEDYERFGEWIEKVYFHAIVKALREFDNSDLTVTPVLMAGDDVCLITNAEYALELAHNIVQNIMELSAAPYYEPQDHEGRKLPDAIAEELRRLNLEYLSACAGVAITRITYPFYEAVKAAEDLCSQAKEKIHEVRIANTKGTFPAFIDWKIVLGQVEPAERYEDMIRNMNVVEKFHIKPLQITRRDESTDHPTFGQFIRLVKTLINALHQEQRYEQEDDPDNPVHLVAISHSELEKIRRATYNGPDAYRQLFRNDPSGHLGRIRNMVEDCFPNLGIDEEVPFIENRKQHIITYVLHDVLEILPYMRDYWTSRMTTRKEDGHVVS